MLVAHVVAPSSLNSTGHVMPVAVAHMLKGEELCFFSVEGQLGAEGGGRKDGKVVRSRGS